MNWRNSVIPAQAGIQSIVIPAKAGIQGFPMHWIPAFAGMTSPTVKMHGARVLLWIPAAAGMTTPGESST